MLKNIYFPDKVAMLGWGGKDGVLEAQKHEAAHTLLLLCEPKLEEPRLNWVLWWEYCLCSLY